MSRERFQHDRRRDFAQALLPVIEVAGNSVSCGDVTRLIPTPTTTKLSFIERGHFRFEQDPGDLATVQQHIVRPFVGEAVERAEQCLRARRRPPEPRQSRAARP